ncbi:DUF7059 domain-containing protein [Demequina globuliformis]|uniref:DUF7059 domain-containing protein n=1 Tax=Demequina globuliformis TaxID=676202 RepID=UPI0007809799|nr:methyltransferase [Demequina globuliformis]
MTTAPPHLSPNAADRLRSDVSEWTVDAVQDVVGERAMRAFGREQVLPGRLAARAAGEDRVALLSRLFLFGDSLTRAQADAALPQLGAQGGIEAGLIAASGASADDEVRATVDLRPTSAMTEDGELAWWIAHDHGEAVTGRAVREDHVLGVGGASTTLASITMRAPVQRTLDLGTGCGIQALHASQHSQQVVATDISRRALAFARFNEALNRPDGAPWDVREGHLLEPVAGEQFDLVVSNPPFVISPPGTPRFEYRDGGLAWDGVVGALASGVGACLNPGGVAQFLGNWLIRDDWTERWEQWLAESSVPVDAWVIQRDVLDPAEYAETWLRDAGVTRERDEARFYAAYEAYMAGFDAAGAQGIGFGAVLLRRPMHGSPTLRRLEEHEGTLQSPLGPHLISVLAAHDWLASASDDDLLGAAYTVAPDVTKETYGRPLQYEPEHILIRQGGGLGRSIKADTALAGLVGACDGELTAGQIAHALAALLDVPASDMVAGLAPALRELVRDGFLLPQ